MTARSFLVRGLLAGVLAGLVAFAVGYVFGEPSIDAAIAVEESEAAHSHDGDDAAGHSHDEEALVSRTTQKTWGMATAMLVFGPALGGLLALVAAGMMGRMGRLVPSQSTAVIALVAFVSVTLVPFLKFPATPPAVGSESTIGARTADYYLYLAISVAAATAAVGLARWLLRRMRPLESVVIAGFAYLVVVVGAGVLMPTVNEVGDFPGDTLWFFRRASLLTLTAMWAVLGVALTYLVRRLDDAQNPAPRHDGALTRSA